MVNKVKEGYKITELGEIPEEWEVKKLDEICEFLDGKRKPIKAEDRLLMQGNIPYYGASGIIDWVNNYLFDDEIILLGEDGENIKSRNVPLAFKVAGKCWVNNHAHVLKIKNNGSDNIDYITYSLENKDYSSYVIGSAQPKLNQAECRKFLLLRPSLKVQQKISSILSSVDEKIENTNNLIEKTRRLKEGLMQRLLTKGIGHDKFKNTVIGRIPEEWEVVMLGEICKIKSSKRVYESDYVKKGIPFYRSKEIIELSKGQSPKIDLYISEDMYKNFKEKYGVPLKGDLFITSVGTIGKTWVSDGRDFYYKDGNITQILDNKEININFISYMFDSNIFRKQYMGQSSGSAQVALTIEKLNRLMIPIPNLEEQGKIVSILFEIDEKIERCKLKKEKLQQLKKGLMQKLLTGKIRV